MRKEKLPRALLCGLGFAGILSAQAPAKVDFGRDVLPILRQNCVGCHGPAQQMSGFRVDRKSVVLGRRGVVPGSSENSFLFHRISGGAYGIQMPPTGALRPEQIAIVKAWIDQGADWPDALANEADVPAVDPKAVALVESLRAGSLAAFLKSVSEDPKLLNARGPGGATPFMYAVLYAGKATLERLLKLGADPNRRNDANATALIWAANDFEKSRLLIDHGADVNARSADMRTPLMIAARRQGNSATVKLLLDHHANANPNPHPATESSPLIEAASAADPASMELLISHGADVKASGEPVLEMGVITECAKCVALVADKDLGKDAYTGTLATVAPLGNLSAVRLALDRGADVNAVDPLGRTPLMYAAVSDLLPLDVVKLLVERGANVNAADVDKNAGDTGWTVLDIAKLHGYTPVVDFLVKAGAKSTVMKPAVLKARQANTIQSALQGSIPLIQRADANFPSKAACVSCHNDSFAAMAVSAARGSGVTVDEKTAAQQVKVNVFGLEKLRDYFYQSIFAPVEDYFGPTVVSYMLIGLDAEHYKPDLNTDAVAMFLKARQFADGHWPYVAADVRPPICSGYIEQTALAMRSLQLYAPQTDKAAYEQSIRLAAAWIARSQSKDNTDRVYRVLGLAWAGSDKNATQKAVRELLAAQRADGGWSDLDSMQSTAYSTGISMFALHTAGVSSSDPAYQRGVRYLLNTQQEDGSWYVKTRALAIQPYFDAGFPNGYDQWISAAGTSWATIALSFANPAPVTLASRGQ